MTSKYENRGRHQHPHSHAEIDEIRTSFMKQSGPRLGQYVAFHNTPEQYDSILIASATLTEPSITAECAPDQPLTDFRLQPVNCRIQAYGT